MNLDIQFKIKSNNLYLKYLHENSYWYKYLNRDPMSFNKFIDELKIKYKLRPSDKINKAIDTIDMLTSIMSSLK